MDAEELRALGARIRQLRTRQALSQEELAERADVARHTISRWERGLNEPRQTELRQLCSALGADLGDLLPVASEPVDRRDFLRNLAGVGLVGLAGLDPAWSLVDIERMQASLRRQKVDEATVANMENIARNHAELYFRLGSLEMLEILQGHVRTTMMLRQGAAPEPLRRRLAGVLTDEAGRAAWHAYDLGRTSTSESFYAVAESAAADAAATESAFVKSFKSIVRVHGGRVREALALVEDATEHGKDADPSMRAWIAAMEAQSAAAAQDRPRADAALHRADAYLNEAGRRSGNRMFWLDPWRLAAIAGAVYEHLGDAREAELRIHPALEYLADRSPRGQSEMLLDLAGIALLQHQADRAVALTRKSLARARDAQSVASIDRVRQFRLRLHPYGDLPGAAELDRELVAV